MRKFLVFLVTLLTLSASAEDAKGHKMVLCFITMMKDDSLNSAKILLDSFKSGMYIIKIGNQSIKYLKK